MVCSCAPSQEKSDMAQVGRIASCLIFLSAAAAALALPGWVISLITIALANGLVVLGLIIMWRAGLVSFGQGLYYCTGAYAVALVGRWTGISDALLLVLIGGASAALVSFVVGFLLARYREIFFAMLSLALSMILYGVLVKTESLGSTDGFSVIVPTFFGYAPHQEALLLALYWLVLVVFGVAAPLVGIYFRTLGGAMAIPLPGNEIRV